jgi:hypothetical protein
MNDFVKRNALLLVGVSLPLLLVVFVLAFHGLARLTAPEPRFPVLYAAFDDYYGQAHYDLDIDDAGRLEIGFLAPERTAPGADRRLTDVTLALYDAAADTLRTFSIQAPDAPPPGQRIALAVPDALAGRTFSAERTAPDGYRFETGGHRGGGLLRELFGGGSRARHHRLVRNGAAYRVPGVDGTPGAWREVFIGWAVDGSE